MLTRLGQLHSVVKGKHNIKEHVWNAENISLETVWRHEVWWWTKLWNYLWK